jgi:hypothetical protein
MKRFLVTLALTCVLSTSALAGSIPTCGAPSPAPASSGVTHGPGVVSTIILTIISVVIR